MDMPTPVSTELKSILVDNRWPARASGRAFAAITAGETADVDAAVRAARGIRAGQVHVNAFGAGGGIKKSGHGREKDFAVLYGVSALRTTIVKHG